MFVLPDGTTVQPSLNRAPPPAAKLPGARQITCIRAKYQVSVVIDGEERTWRLQACQDEIDEIQRKRRAAQDAERRIAFLPKTHDEYRARAVQGLHQALGVFRRMILEETKLSGFSFDAAALEDFDEAAQALAEVLEEGATRFDAKRHQALVMDLRVTAARGNIDLQSMLKRALAVASP
jgi:hypothetical protein